MLDNSSLNQKWLSTNWKRVTLALIVLLNCLGPAAAASSQRNAVVQPSKKEKIYYKCYQQSSIGDVRETCYGRQCVTTTHLNTGYRRLWCRNESDLLDERANDNGCRTLDGEEGLPGQADRVCLCTDNYCNAATRPSARAVAGLGMALTAAVWLRLGTLI